MRTLRTEELASVVGGTEECWCDCGPQKGNNGLGNGDQTAPGNSYDHNKAENNAAFPGTGNPPGSGKWAVVPN